MGWGELFALSSAMVWALAVILLRRSGETLPAFELNLFKNTLGVALMVPTILFFNGFELPGYTALELVIVFASGVIGIAVADTWYLKALNMMGASRTGVVASLFSPFVILLSAVFLGERMVLWQWFGFALIMSGVLLVTWRVRRSSVDSEHLTKGVMYGVMAMLAMAVGIVMVKDILEARPFLWTMELRLAGGVVGMLVYLSIRGQWQTAIQNMRQPQPWGLLITASVLSAYVALLLWLAGYRLIDASIASALNETNGAFIVILAWLMLGEELNFRKVAGVSLTLAGVIIMISV